jgi:aryl-alcohol dehydrogenase-like predicted oxidoreductase
MPVLRLVVRLGNSGLKVSKIILGCMSYGASFTLAGLGRNQLTLSIGTPKWQGWVLEEEEGIKHIKLA